MTGRYQSIQYLRGVAATLVVASHAFLYPLVDEPMLFGRWGWLGVILFFVISGFIMVTVTGNGRFDGGLFLRRRALRVIPLYWGITLITAGLAFWAPALFKSMTFDLSQLWRSLLFIPFYNETSGGIHPIYKLGWTLNYEVYFYLCFALLWFLGPIARVLTLTVVFVGLATYGFVAKPTNDLSVFYTSFMPLAFCVGMGLGLMALNTTFRASTGLILAAATMGAAGLVLGMAWPASIVEDWTAFVGCLLFAGAIVFIGVQLEHKLAKVALLEQAGDASYSTYLSHIYAVGALSWLVYTILPFGNPVIYVGVAILTIACATVFGLFLHRLIELPLGRWLSPFAARSKS